MSALILISVLGVLVLYLGLFAKKGWLAPVAIIGLLGAIALFATGWHIDHHLLVGMVQFSHLSIGFNIGMAIITALIFLFGTDYYARQEHHVAEQYALMLFSLVGGFILTSYTSMLMLFVGIEILSIPLYILAGGKKQSLRSNGYMGPGAGPGPYHHYTFTLYAVDTKIDVTASQNAADTRAALINAMDGHVLGKAVLVARFHR